jgi:hypothetical protein
MNNKLLAPRDARSLKAVFERMREVQWITSSEVAASVRSNMRLERQRSRRQLSQYASSAMHDASRFTNDIRAVSLSPTTKTTNLRRLIPVQFYV